MAYELCNNALSGISLTPTQFPSLFSPSPPPPLSSPRIKSPLFSPLRGRTMCRKSHAEYRDSAANCLSNWMPARLRRTSFPLFPPLPPLSPSLFLRAVLSGGSRSTRKEASRGRQAALESPQPPQKKMNLSVFGGPPQPSWPGPSFPLSSFPVEKPSEGQRRLCSPTASLLSGN